MSAWKVHLVWVVVAVVAAAAWGQHVASRKEREFENERTAARLHRRAPEAGPKGPPSEAGPVPASSGGAAEASSPPSPDVAPSSPKHALKDELLSPEQIRSLLQSGNKGDIERAVRALEKLQDRAAKMAIIKELLANPDRNARERALDLLRKSGDPEAAELMAKTLLSDPEERVRARAARYLGDVGGPTALAALQEAARSGTMDVQVAAAISLGKLGDTGAAQAILPQIARMLESPDGAVREDAVSYLDDLRSPSSLPLLGQALRDSNSNVRKDAIDALQKLAIPQVIPLLEQAASDPNPQVARNAVRALEKLRNPDPKKPK